ncbi:DEAD/DEAH box helicase family protein [Paenibacillus alginolyticus]|uniref:DEAD/DEAH box helicase n=1 Tax=Paenibacillus alginolyticus TaxID=59839 RepID=UPI0003FA9E5E|nr:helicase-related protein [Paenibacillus alginolyticus]MCY9665114.1 DEAD/DEAH box helicase family protein [Paenibacillus alginolyticus]
MKVQLYAVSLGKEWEWRLTIHSQTDIQYWFEQYAADAGLVLFEPFISLGQGVRMLERLRGERSFEFGTDDGRMLQRFRLIAKECEISNGKDLDMKMIRYEMWRQGMFPRIPLNATVYAKIVEACSGKSLLIEEFQQLLEAAGIDLHTEDAWLSYLQLGHLNDDLEVGNGLEIMERRDWRKGFRKMISYRCNRCGSGEERMFWSDCLHCGQVCPYCEECLTMGRSRFCSLLVLGRSKEIVLAGKGVVDSTWGQSDHEGCAPYEHFRTYLEPWGLSDAQARASLEGLRYISGKMAEVGPSVRARVKSRAERNDRTRTPRRFLIWAVTGAGKTEMIFPFIHHTVARGGRVLIATPRKDVVLELQPRIGRAFVDYSVVTLYGGSEQRWEQGQITIATTHQLLRFHEAFDLVIIDEIDAFPYHNNPMLTYAAAKVCKPNGTNILLSATPPRAVRQAAKRGRLPHARVPVRFHRHPLPVPQLVSVPPLRRVVRSQALPVSLFKKLVTSVERGAQVFVFVPNIQLVEPMVYLLRVKLSYDNNESSLCVEGTSSKDPARTEKVQLFRNREIRVLVTTTILERGVTVPKSDVFIMDADSQLFDEAALVQMAGRAGRSQDDPAGKVYFAAKEITQSQKEAIRQIKQMNRIARKRGYLLRGK